MGESGVAGNPNERTDQESVTEQVKITDTEQPGGSESEDDSSGGGNGEGIIYHGGPDDPRESDTAGK